MIPFPSGPTAIFCIYVSGALRKFPPSAMAITEIELEAPTAQTVVPSSGSRAISSFGPLRVPTSSPI